MPSTIISIDGNIGSGKSTLIELLKCHYKGDVVVLEEPVNIWNNIVDDAFLEDRVKTLLVTKKSFTSSSKLMDSY